MLVAWDGLVMPVQSSALCVYRNNGIGENDAIRRVRSSAEVWEGVGYAGKHFSGLGIERIGRPQAAAGLGPVQCGRKAPYLIAGLGVEGHQPSSDAEIAGSDPDEHFVAPADGRRGE